jgi:hypothetical protein
MDKIIEFALQHPVLFTMFVIFAACIIVITYLLVTACEGYEDPETGFNYGPRPEATNEK